MRMLELLTTETLEALFAGAILFLGLALLFVLVVVRFCDKHLFPFSPVSLFLIYYGVHFFFCPLYILLTNDVYYWQSRADNVIFLRYQLMAMGVASIGLFAFLGGYLIQSRPRLAIERRDTGILVFRDALALNLVIAVLSAWLFAQFLEALGFSLPEFLVVLGRYRTGEFEGTGLFTFPATVILPLSALFVVAATKVKGPLLTLSVLLYVALCAGFSLILGFRIAFIIPVIAAVIFQVASGGSRTKLIYYAVGIVGFILLGLYGNLREQLGTDIESSRTLDVFLSPLTRVRGSEVLAIVLYKDVPYDFFSVLPRELFLSWIPKALVDIERVRQADIFGLQIMVDFLVSRDGVGFTRAGGITPTLPGYLAWQSGVSGVVLVMCALGWIGRSLDIQLASTKTSPEKLLLFSILSAYFVALEDSPVDSLSGIVLSLAVYLFLLSILQLIGRFQRTLQTCTRKV